MKKCTGTFSSVLAGLFAVALVVGCSAFESQKSTPKRPAVGPTGTGLSLFRMSYDKGEITLICRETLEGFRAKIPTLKNAIELDWELAELGDVLWPMTFMAYVSTNAESRKEASKCEEDLNKFNVEIFTNRHLYEVVQATEAAGPDEARLISELRRNFELNGMALSDDDLADFVEVKSELAALEAQFSSNLNEDTSSVEFTRDELEGVSEDFLNRLKKGKGKGKEQTFIVTTKTADYTHLMENAKNPETRRRLMDAYEHRAAEANTVLLEKAVLLRQELARIMKYPTWADYRTDGRMAKNSASALNLLNDLKTKLQPRLAQDMNLLLEAKKQDFPDAEKLDAWDIRYYNYQVKKRDFELDDEVIRQYFPKDTVMKGVFDIYETILGVKYVEVPDGKVWHPDVKLYEVQDGKSGQVLAYFFTDFFPREGKYGHAAAFPLIYGRRLADGNYSRPVASIVSNFTPPTSDKPSLLNHDEVETLFHEFGHIMHQVLTRAPYAYLAGTSVAQDFVEAPSQMLEGWAWDPEMLAMITGHYERPEEKLPSEIVAKLIGARDHQIGYFYSRQIVLGLTDLRMHTASGRVDSNKTYRDTHKEILGIDPLPNSMWMASFGHMMGGYDAGYYGYIWSEVYAADMFTAFEGRLLDSVVGGSYRMNILESGNMRDPLELITGFLGREPNNQAFLKKLGL